MGAVPSIDALPSPSPSPAPAYHRSFVDLSIDGEPAGSVLAVFNDGTDVLLTRGDLRQHGIPIGKAPCVTISDACYISLADLKPSIGYSFDENALSVDISLGAGLLPRKAMAVGLQAPEMSDVHVRGNVLDYSFNGGPQQKLAGTLDDRFGIANDVVLEGGVGRTTSGFVQRTFTDITIDDPSAQRRDVVGDTASEGDAFGGGFEYGGFTVQRQFSLDPYSITYPTPTLQTAITQPSQAQIYVNGVLVKTIDLPPGYYTLNNLPVVAGISNAQVVIRNAYGASTFNTGTFGGVSLLRPGLSDYQFGAGFLRENLGEPDQSYGPAVGTASYRIGISNAATIGGLLQSADGTTDAGATYDAQIGAGVLQAAAGVSAGSGARNGSAGLLSYSATTTKNGFAIALQAQSGDFTPVSSFVPAVEQFSSAVVAWSRQITHQLSLTLSEQISNYADQGAIKQTALAFTQQLGVWTMTGSYGIGSSPATAQTPAQHTQSLSVSFIRTLPSRSNTTLSEAVNVQTGPGAASGVEINSSALSPMDSSYNAVLQTKPGGGIEGGGWVNLASQYGTLQLYGSPGSTLSQIGGELDGAIVSTSKGTFFTQSVPDAYALVVTGVPKAPVYYSGMYVGATTRNGAMVVPFLQSNFANNISVSNGGLPLDQILVGAGSGNVAPSYHNGALVEDRVVTVHAIVGKVMFQEGNNRIPPMYGDARLELAQLHYDSPIDDEGRVYFQNVPPGRYDLRITVPGKTCTTAVDIPAFSSVVYKMGTVACKI